MNDVVVCSCGKSLRVPEGITVVRCPICRRTNRLAGRHGADSAIKVFGLDPPPPSVPHISLGYQVVEVSSETPSTPPRAKPAKDVDDDDDGRPYPVEATEPVKPVGKSQDEMWAPDIDLRNDPHSPYDLKKRRKRPQQEWLLEQAWYECLSYPLRGGPLIAVLGFVLTLATFGLLQVLREQGPIAWFFALIGVAALAYACGFLTCVLNAGASGQVQDVHWPGANVKILLESLLAAFMSFLAGPIVPAALAVYFWIYSGELLLIDQLILTELMVLTVGYWLLVFLSAALSDNWGSLLPAAVVERARRLGAGRSWMAVGLAVGIFLFHGRLLLAALEMSPAGTFLVLLFCWMSLLFWMVFLMRWLGVSVYRLKIRTRRASKGE